MATMKRRVVYLSDEDWKWLVDFADSELTSASSIIREGIQMFREEHDLGEPIAPGHAVIKGTLNDPATGDLTPQLGRIPFSTRPFTPVPKHR